MNKSELIFLYDATNSNPNGDPTDMNKPRIDEKTEINLVTDVRLKRTIRDYIHNYKNQEIFIKEIQDEKGNIQDAKKRALDYSTTNGEYDSLEEMKIDLKENIINNCIDIRLFGATIPVELNKNKKGSVNLKGPVQFKMGKSLHKVNVKYIKGTGAFASNNEKIQKTFREEYILPYSLINFYGIVNENAAIETELTDKDLELFIESIWEGTKNLISRSKFGQFPRLLLQIEYCEKNYFIGDLDNKISIVHNLEDDYSIRSISDIKIDLSKLIKTIDKNKDKISKINYKIDEEVIFKDYTHDELIDNFNNLGIETFELTF